ncbi:S4 domain-containing protein YaaA [Bombilactobacillus folatiphilus]|uniref:S4 domain-containing protein YaaA n=1 Tax=Bombilactobacillus folatiphilus TaxID=2923362 RepID=A0ABY4P8S1_9LACO|nr:S4 domain-containing protein YaaA [Bombilactobacillus folatiphilus]UQS82128.1 S4 domain-containing protein YaaA [Bombilactobacillus folatiphilus]
MQIKLKSEYITLTQLLKEAGVIATGGQAKWYLQDNLVLLNGVPENRRGKKLRQGDQVKLADGSQFEIVE